MIRCDFCPKDDESVKRYRLDLIEPMTPTPHPTRLAFWFFDLCEDCRNNRVYKLMDNFVLPKTDEVPIIKKGSNFAFKRIEDETKGKTPEN